MFSFIKAKQFLRYVIRNPTLKKCCTKYLIFSVPIAELNSPKLIRKKKNSCLVHQKNIPIKHHNIICSQNWY